MRKLLFIIGLFTIMLIISSNITLLSDKLDNANKATSLIESYNIAFKEANKWNNSSQIYLITSVDDEILDNRLNGLNVKGRNWNFTFVIPNTNEH